MPWPFGLLMHLERRCDQRSWLTRAHFQTNRSGTQPDRPTRPAERSEKRHLQVKRECRDKQKEGDKEKERRRTIDRDIPTRSSKSHRGRVILLQQRRCLLGIRPTRSGEDRPLINRPPTDPHRPTHRDRLTDTQASACTQSTDRHDCYDDSSYHCLRERAESGGGWTVYGGSGAERGLVLLPCATPSVRGRCQTATKRQEPVQWAVHAHRSTGQRLCESVSQ